MKILDLKKFIFRFFIESHNFCKVWFDRKPLCGTLWQLILVLISRRVVNYVTFGEIRRGIGANHTFFSSFVIYDMKMAQNPNFESIFLIEIFALNCSCFNHWCSFDPKKLLLYLKVESLNFFLKIPTSCTGRF